MPNRCNCFVTNAVGVDASSTTNQNRFGICFNVWPNRVISAICSGRRKVGVIIYNGGGSCYTEENKKQKQNLLYCFVLINITLNVK